MSPTASEQGTVYGPSTVRLPLSAAQRDIWMAHGLDTSGCRYNIGEYRELTGPLDTGLVACCWYRLACEADALRIRGVGSDDDGTLWQEVHAKPLGRSLSIVDLSDENDPVAAARAWMDAELARPFDLAHDWLTRHALIRAGRTAAGEERWFYFHAFHHLAIDGMGIALLDERLVDLYDRAAAGRPWGETPFGTLAELLDEDAAYRTSPEAAEDRAYWAAHLADVEPVPRLAEGHTAATRPGALPFTRRTVLLGAERSDRLKEVARTHRAPWTMLVLALVAAYVHRVGGADTPVLGLPVTSRRTELARRTPGMMSNVIPLRVPVRTDDSLADLLTTVRARAREGLEHQRTRYEDACRDLGLGETARRIASPQVNIMAFAPGKRFFGLPTVQHNLGNGPVEDLAVGVYDLGPDLGLRIDFDASPEVCDIQAVAGHQDRFLKFAERLLAEPGVASSRTELLDTGERRKVLEDWSGRSVRYGGEPLLTARFEEQVRVRPDASAVVFGGGSLSYGELNGRANRLARRLRESGLGRGDLAGVLLDRGVDFAVAVIAVVKTGAGYVLLDPEFPDERLRGTVEEAGLRVLVTDSAQHARGVGGAAVLIDGERESIAAYDGEDLRVALAGEDAACVMFTSGSTGRPKGIVSSHRNLVSTVSAQSYASFGPGEVFLQCSPVSWDAFSLEFWGALLHGGTTVLQPGQRPEPAVVAELSVRHRVTMLQLSSSLFNYLVDEHPETFAAARIVFTGGEPASPTHVDRLHGLHPHLTVTNGYGPAESMGFTTTHTVDRGVELGASVPIGRPLVNKSAFVLDERLGLVPPGVTGELYLAGEGVAHGYLAQCALTATRFLPNPFGPAGSRLYRTGDRARWDGDGNLHYAGRSDGQVKIRGFRIEPTGIETVLTGHPGIAQAVLLATDHLTAYVVPTPAPGDSVTPASLRVWLRERLPEHMVPAHFVLLDRLPLTPNGKIDKRALPQVEAPLTATGRAPRTELEELVRDMTGEVLGSAAPLSIDDSFFDHGGHSLLAARLTHRIAATFGVTLTLRDVFQHPTPVALARRITEATGRPALPALTRAAVRPDRVPLSYAQQRLWLVAGLHGPDTAYNVPMTFRLSGEEVDATALRAAVGDLVRRHAPLRTRFATAEGQPHQVITPAEEAAAGVFVEVREVTPGEAGAELHAAARHAFDLATEHPLRVTLLREGDGRATLLVLLHHIATDGQSLRPLFADLSAAYAARTAGRAPDWEPLPVDYADYALWQRPAVEGSLLDEQLAYWRTALAGLPEELPLVTDRPRPATAGRRGDAIRVDFGRDLHKRVLELSRAERCTPFMVLQAALAATLTRLGAGTDIPLGSPVAGRPDEALTDLVGFFVNTLVLRTDTSGDPGFRELLTRVRTTDLDAFTHQDAPFDLVLEAVNPARSLARHPLFQICLTLETGPPVLPAFPGIQATAADPPATGSVKFDLEFLLGADEETGLSGTVLYSSDLYDRATVERIVEALRRVLEHAVTAPETVLSELEILDLADRRRMLGEWSGRSVRYGGEPLLTARFEEQVRVRPDASAVVFGGGSLSYGELNGRANRLARRLRESGLGRGDLAGVLLDRGVDFAVAVIAVVKTGAGYVLLDPEFPDERLRGTVEEAGLRVLVTDSAQHARGVGGAAVLIDGERESIAAQEPGDLDVTLTSEDAACVMFTSGSTGRPKGIVSSHRNLVSTVSAQSYASFGPGEVFLQCSPVSWDAFSLEFWGALLHGGTTVLQPGQRPEPAVVAELSVRHRVTMLQLSSSLFNYLVDEHPETFAATRIVFTGGEPASPTHVDRLHGLHPHLTVTNGYGPAESMGFTTTHTVDRGVELGASVPIGRPLVNKSAFVLDERLGLVPPGVTGELYLAGEGVAHGYLEQCALTATRFLPNPFGPAGSRLYRTGDRARWDGDGNLHYAGRSDGQVKIRGFRIEPTEIETVLTGHPGIAQAVLLATDHLTAYVVPTPAPGPEPQEVRRWLGERLPDHMVPAFVVALDRLPLTPNGKIDKRALPVVRAPEASCGGRAPRTPLETTVLDLFTEVLPAKGALSVDDSFFDHGGHSLLAARLTHRIGAALGVSLTLRDVFRHPTPAALAHHIQSRRAAGAAAPQRVRPTLRRRTDDH